MKRSEIPASCNAKRFEITFGNAVKLLTLAFDRPGCHLNNIVIIYGTKDPGISLRLMGTGVRAELAMFATLEEKDCISYVTVKTSDVFFAGGL